MPIKKRLTDLRIGEQGVILHISDNVVGEERRRLLDLGFISGAEITVENRSPSGNPVAYRIKGAVIALRKAQTDEILILAEESGVNL